MYYTVESALILTASGLKLMKWRSSFLTWFTKRAFPKFGKNTFEEIIF